VLFIDTIMMIEIIKIDRLSLLIVVKYKDKRSDMNSFRILHVISKVLVMIEEIGMDNLINFIEEFFMELFVFLCKFRNDFLKRGADERLIHTTPLFGESSEFLDRGKFFVLPFSDFLKFFKVFWSKLRFEMFLFYDVHRKLDSLAFIFETILCFQDVDDSIGPFVDVDERLYHSYHLNIILIRH
jgi:hypothetical protein